MKLVENINSLLDKKLCKIKVKVPSSSYFILSQIYQASNKDILFITKDDDIAQTSLAILKFIDPQINIITFPAWDCLPYDRVSPKKEIMVERLKSLFELNSKLKTQKNIIIVTIPSLVQKVIPKDIINKLILKITKSSKINQQNLIKYLIENGYNR